MTRGAKAAVAIAAQRRAGRAPFDYAAKLAQLRASHPRTVDGAFAMARILKAICVARMRRLSSGKAKFEEAYRYQSAFAAPY